MQSGRTIAILIRFQQMSKKQCNAALLRRSEEGMLVRPKR
jgi:hypothetical protein